MNYVFNGYFWIVRWYNCDNFEIFFREIFFVGGEMKILLMLLWILNFVENIRMLVVW